MSYVNRHPSPTRRAGSAELMYLLVVLAAGVATAWWAGHKIGMDLSSITTMASVLGLTETGRASHGVVGYSPQLEAQAHTPAAPYCQAGQAPAFAAGLTGLKQQIGDVMGTPVECEHAVSPAGDTIQQTSTGLAAYNKLTNTVSFTDGWRHYAVTPRGFVSWEGAESNPPAG
jgi:hypothetical protein